jgi:hypothetical protein
MKLDPNKWCINFEQHLGWALIHDCVAHPLMALTLYKVQIFLDFHNYTSQKAKNELKAEILKLLAEDYGGK